MKLSIIYAYGHRLCPNLQMGLSYFLVHAKEDLYFNWTRGRQSQDQRDSLHMFISLNVLCGVFFNAS
jgi:hypothetical protein